MEFVEFVNYSQKGRHKKVSKMRKKDVKNEQGTKIKQKNRPHFAGDVDSIFGGDECTL